jgi:hypothetical protein
VSPTPIPAFVPVESPWNAVVVALDEDAGLNVYVVNPELDVILPLTRLGMTNRSSR